MLTEKDEQTLDEYLSKIESKLKGISVANRSDILLELDSHIKESLSSGDQSLKTILSALGDPTLVANRYLLAKGAKPVPPKKHTWLKALGLGTLAVFSLFLIAIIMLIKSFSPVLSINEETGRVIVLGGLIDVNGKDSKFSIGKGFINVEGDDMDLEFNTFEQKFAGTIELKKEASLDIRGQNGKLNFQPSPNSALTYRCKVGGVGGKVKEVDIIDQKSKDRIVFNMGSNILTGAKCSFLVPKALGLNVELGNGKINFENLQQNIFAKINNGKINFEKSPKTAYNFDAQVTTGSIKGLTETDRNSRGYKVDLKIINGKIMIE